MIDIEKSIIKIGNSNGIVVDKTIETITGFHRGDKLILKCSKNKAIITKKEN